MSDPLAIFQNEFNQSHTLLLKNAKQDDDGYYEVDERKIQNFFKARITAYANYIAADGSMITSSSQLNFSLDKLFHLEKIKVDNLNFSPIIQGINNHMISKIDKPHSLLEIVFDDCKLSNLVLEGRTHKSFFSRLRIFNCNINSCAIKESFFDNRTLDGLSVEDSFFQNLSFSSGYNDFQKKIFFKGCTFGFKLAASGCVFRNTLSFVNCTFNKFDSPFFDHGASFRPYCRFNNTKFQNTTEFIDCIFLTSPKFHEAELHSDTSFRGSVFWDTKSESSLGDYRALKQATHTIGDEQRSIEFHALELESRHNCVIRKGHHTTWPIWMASYALKLFNNYGRDFLRPFYWLLLSLIMFACMHVSIDSFACNMKDIINISWFVGHCGQPVHLAIIHSASMSFGPLGLLIEPDGMVITKTLAKGLSVLQAILSSIFWFVIIVQFRRQFKL